MPMSSKTYKRISADLRGRCARTEIALTALLGLTAMGVYARMVVPSMLDGDPGEFQYVAAVLGIPHPPGFPLYLFLGWIWSLAPIGTLAYRMNLLSALFGAATIALLFVVLRQHKRNVLAAVSGCVMLALLPPFWQYSTQAAVYTLQTCLMLIVLILLQIWENTGQSKWLWSAMLTFGLGLTNHPSFLLLAPATATYVVIAGGGFSRRLIGLALRSITLVLLPLVTYLYFPLRGHQLLSNDIFALGNWPMAMAQGIVTPLFCEGPQGLLQYLTATPFVSSMARSVEWNTLIGTVAYAVVQSLGLPGAALSIVGLARVVRNSSALSTWLLIGLFTFFVVATHYAYTTVGEITDFVPYFDKYFLPGYVMVAMLTARGMDALIHGIRKIFLGLPSPVPFWSGTLELLLMTWMAISRADIIEQRQSAWIEQSASIQAKWETIRRFPPSRESALVGHWGDLTPLWYLQNAEGWRPDLVALYPPVDGQIDAWLTEGRPVYVAGPLLGWAPRLVSHKYLVPWGPLLLVSDQKPDLSSPLTNSVYVTLGSDRPLFRLLGYDLPKRSFKARDVIEIAAYWEILGDVPLGDYLVYFSLSTPDLDTKSPGDVLVINWLPTQRLSPGQRALGTFRYHIPDGVPSGEYIVSMFIYSIGSARNLDIVEIEDDESMIDLGTIVIQGAR